MAKIIASLSILDSHFEVWEANGFDKAEVDQPLHGGPDLEDRHRGELDLTVLPTEMFSEDDVTAEKCAIIALITSIK